MAGSSGSQTSLFSLSHVFLPRLIVQLSSLSLLFFSSNFKSVIYLTILLPLPIRVTAFLPSPSICHLPNYATPFTHLELIPSTLYHPVSPSPLTFNLLKSPLVPFPLRIRTSGLLPSSPCLPYLYYYYIFLHPRSTCGEPCLFPT